jgi:hypothetical protein|tara:strand:- start:1171 stop:1368 length:198 start_codon:yes stop_codon:yes gene_type:complete
MPSRRAVSAKPTIRSINSEGKTALLKNTFLISYTADNLSGSGMFFAQSKSIWGDPDHVLWALFPR